MMSTGHRIVGAWAGAGAACVAGLPPWAVGTSAALAVVTAAGKASPDADQSWLRFLGHRRLTHDVAVPLVAAAGLWLSAAPWPVWALLTGWCSHLGADFLFGKAGYGRGKGVPVFGIYVGVGLKVGGWLEHATSAALVGAALVVVLLVRG